MAGISSIAIGCCQGEKLKIGWREFRLPPAPGRSASLVHVFRRPCQRSPDACASERGSENGRRTWTVKNADGRDQGFQSTKLRYTRKPASALFSGWNWVAKMLSR